MKTGKREPLKRRTTKRAQEKKLRTTQELALLQEEVALKIKELVLEFIDQPADLQKTQS